MLIKYEEELPIYLFDVKRVPEYNYAKYYLMHATLIMLERTMHLVIILLLVKCRFENH